MSGRSGASPRFKLATTIIGHEYRRLILVYTWFALAMVVWFERWVMRSVNMTAQYLAMLSNDTTRIAFNENYTFVAISSLR